METQKIFRKKFMHDLINGVHKNTHIKLFENREFQINEEDTLNMPHIQKPLGLVHKMNRDDDFQSAIVLYEAYNKLTPLEASDGRLWNYLSIKDLYPYLINRWPSVYQRLEGVDKKSYLLEHYLLEKNSYLLRHGLAGLWWSVYISRDETNSSDKYNLTKVLFWNQTFRTRTLGTYLFARKKDLLLGFLDYCLEKGKENFGNFEKEHQKLTEYINNIGGSKSLAVFTRNEIKQLLIDRFPL